MKLALAVAGILLAALALLVPGAGLYFESGRGARCAGCHEMQAGFDVWRNSSHREIGCEKCHGDALTLDASFHRTNIGRAFEHVRGEVPEQIRLDGAQAEAISERCRGCHRQEYAEWKSGPHSATYARIFLDRKHNTQNLLIDDCLRCHGMYFDGGIRDLVTPVDRKGPWRLARMEMSASPAIPCLVCHSIHHQGEPLRKSTADGRVEGPRQEIARPSLAYFDRRGQRPVPLADLPLPAMVDGARPVRMSPDQRQALCYQCHAPMAGMQVGSGDDRTATGVHEGISCLACHAQHAQNSRASCAACHPKMSNCGLDVEKMDTTFRSPASSHNIHWVKCADCHPKGVPPKKVARLEKNR